MHPNPLLGGYSAYRSLFELMLRSVPHPNPPLGKGRGQKSHFSKGNSSHPKLKVVNDRLAPPLSKGRLGGV
jgi:hypothetical protein